MKLPKELQKKKKKKGRKADNKKKKVLKNDFLSENSTSDFQNLFKSRADLSKNRDILNKKGQKEILAKIRNDFPILKKKIQNNITELEKIVREYNPIHLLHYLCIKHSFQIPETYKESESVSMEIWIEYALSFITTIKFDALVKEPDDDILRTFEGLIINIINSCRNYYMMEGVMGSLDSTQKSIRFQSILRYLGIRGDSYEIHHLELILQTFQPHDAFLQSRFGFSTQEFITFINNIRSEIQTNIISDGELMQKLRILHSKVRQYIVQNKKEKNIEDIELSEDEIKDLEKSEEFRNYYKNYQKIMKKMDPFYFKLKLSDKLPVELLERFSLQFGKNLSFLQGEPYWPLNESLIYMKPLIKHDNEYYGFGSTIIYRNAPDILESLIRDKDPSYYNNRFLKKKSKVLEKLALNYLNKIMPSAKVYRNLFYEKEEEGEIRRYETDGLLIFDENLFIIEAKANTLPLSAKRGAILRLESTVKKIIDKAYNQGLRCKNHIMNSKEAKFYDKNGLHILTLKSKDFRFIYLINPTYEKLNHLSTQLHNLKTFNLLEGKEWPWTIFINDLRILSEIVESSSIFLLYLQRRIRMNDLELFMTFDELDYFMFFLEKGLYFEDIEIDENQKMSVIGLTDKLDRYYLYKHGYVSDGEKPLFNIPVFYKDIVKKLEDHNQKGFSFAAISLLGLDSKDHKMLSKMLKVYKKVSFKTGKELKMFFHYNNPNIGLMFVIRTKDLDKDWREFKDFLEIIMYKYKSNIGIMYKCVYHDKSQEVPDINFVILEKEWKFNSKMEDKVKNYSFKGMKTI